MSTIPVAREGRPRFEKIITSSQLMLPVFDQADRAAKVDATVLITGESGTGKELIAETIHANSPRNAGPFVVINMAAVPENLIESELFGHVAGAFADATDTRIGKFEAADGGTLFIDEIGDLPLECQAKLLRVLENHCVTPIGSNEERNTNVRLIAATSRNLEKMVRDGAFREELYYRLNIVAIGLPPLRERTEDVQILAEHFLKEFAAAYKRPEPILDQKLIHFLQSYEWPGNIRQLRNCVESMFVIADSLTLTMDCLPPMLLRTTCLDQVHIEVPHGLTLEDVEKAVVLQTLDRHRGNRTRAARTLGISVRTLQRRLKCWGET